MTSTTGSKHLANLLSWFCYRCNYILIFALVFASLQVKSQSEDVLLKSIKHIHTNRHDSIYYELFKVNRVSDRVKAKHYALLSLQIATAADHFLIQGKSCRALGHLYAMSDQVDSSSFYLHQGIRIASKYSFSELLMNLTNELGFLHERLDVYDSALFYYVSTYDQACQNKSYKYQAIACSNIGTLYSFLENYPQAIAYFKRANDIVFANNIKEDFDLNANRANLARVYNEQGLYKDALEQYNLIKLSCKEDCDDHVRTVLAYGLGYNNFKRKNFTVADSFFHNATMLARKENNRLWLANSLYYLSIIASEAKNDLKAIEYLNEAEEISRSINHKRRLLDIYEQFSFIYENIGPIDKAMKYQKLSAQLKDSIFNKKVANALTVIQLRQQRRQSDQIIERHEIAFKGKIADANFISIALFVNCLIAVMIIYVAYRALAISNRRKKTLEHELVMMLDAHQIDQRQLYTERMQFNYLLTRVSGFLSGPINSLVNITKLYDKNSTPEQNKEYVNKVRTICVTEILGVLKNIMRLCGIKNSGLLCEEIEVSSVITKVHREFMDHENSKLMNFTVNKTVNRKIKTDIKHLVTVIKNGILYFARSKDISTIEISFDQDGNTTIITIKNHLTSPDVIIQEKLFNLFSAQILALKLHGDTILAERNEYSVLTIIIPTDYSISQNKVIEEIEKVSP